MRNPKTSFADLVDFVEEIATTALSEELPTMPVLEAEIITNDQWIKQARKLTGETHRPVGSHA